MKKLYTVGVALALAAGSFAQNLIDLSLVGTYETGVFDDGAIEIVTYDAANKHVIAVNASTNSVDVFNISNPASITLGFSIDVSPYGKVANSVAFHNGVIAAAIENNNKQENGRVVFFNDQGNYLADVEVGALPDMLMFTHDGNKVLVANEGEPSDEYDVDPHGTVSIIDVSGGAANVTQANVTQLTFDAFEGNYDANIRVFGPLEYAFEDFQDTTVGLSNLTVYSRFSNSDWYYDSFSGDYFAEANGYGADTASDEWLMGEVDLRSFTDASFSFYSAKNFSGGDLQVLVSTDYDGSSDPLTATWADLTDSCTLSTGGYVDTFSGDVSLANYISSSTWIAIRYTTTGIGSGDGALWQIDDIEVKGTTLSLAANLEPEYIAVAPDNSTAWVVCQENNALATIDLTTNTITALSALGFKDWMAPGNVLDASNRADDVVLKNWPLYGMYQPDAIKAFEHNGAPYIISVNEGDARDYDGFSEESRVEDLTLDPTAFPNAADLQNEDSLGRMNITTTLGDTDGDGDYDELYAYGARSFSIWDASANLVYDSEADIAMKVFAAYPAQFNSNNDDNDSFKSRSDDKGTEPEAVEVAEIEGTRFAFVGLERMGGVMVYNISDPTNPTFVSYFLNRDFNVAADAAGAGDLGPECLYYISESESPNGQRLLLSGNEVSGTLSIYAVGGTIGMNEEELKNTLQLFPNPAIDIINFNREVTRGVIVDVYGRGVMEVRGTSADVSELSAGIYTLIEGETRIQFIKK